MKWVSKRRNEIYHHLNKVCCIEWMHRRNEIQAAE